MSDDEDSRRVAAYRPKRSTDSRWVEIQKNTFTNWVNESLRPRGESVQELGEDLRDGTRLATLLEALSDRKIPRINRNPINNLQKMDNVSRSLDLMKKEGIKTVNIGNEDVLEGNEKLMLGLIWTLIQHYQISRGSGQRGAKYSPKKHMLLWLQTVLPECRITNLSTDWNDGIALSALVDYCRPGLVPHWRSLNRQDALQNCRNAMDIAEREFNIPQVVSPEDFSDPSLDELSGMTYLSYYVKEDGPGYDAALQALNSLVPEAKVNNFQGDLADGRVLCGMMHQLGGACPSYHSLSPQEASDNIAQALNWGKSLGVTPTFTAEEVTSGQVPLLAIMSYIAQVQAKADPEGRLIRRRSSGFHDENNLLDTEVLTQPELQSSTAVEIQQSMQAEPNVAFTPSHAEEPDRGRPDFTFPPPPSSPPPVVAESTTFFVPPSPPASDNDPAETQETARYYSEIPSPVYQPPSPTTYVYAPPSPREEPTPIATHQPLPMSCHQEVAMEMVDEPLIVPEYVAPVFAPPPRSGGYGGLDLSRVSVAGNGVNQAPVGKPADIRITPTGAVGGNFVVEAESPGGRSHPVSLQKERTGYLTGHFTPEEIGQYQVSVKCDGRDVPSSPFNCNVYDPDRVRVMGMNRALLGSLAAFGVETGTAGEGDIDVTVRGPNGRKCPNKIRPEGAGNYRVTYSPNETGWHEVEIEFNGDDIPGSPFRQEVVDSWNVTAEGEGLGPKVTGSQMHEFSVLGTAGGELMVNIQSPSGRRVPETLGARYGDYLCSYVPTEAGMHTIDVAYNGMTVQGSPFHVEVTDASAVSLFPVDQGIIGRPVDFDIDASRAGNGRIDVTVMDGRTSLPVNLSPSGGNRYSASFVPQTANPHDVTVTFEGQNVPRSPFRVNIIDASRVRASGDGLDRVPIGTGTEFFVDSQGGGDADVAVKITGPTGRDVPARVSGGNGHWTVQYTPTEVCDHNIMVTFAGMQIYGSPFLSHCYDINQVQVGDIPNGKMGQPVQVEIDTSRAGHGDLAANVSVNYQNVPCDLRSRGADSYLLTFVPQTTVTHDLVFKFNGSIIPGCPYRCKIVDASQVTAHGDGLDRIPVDRPTNFYIDTSRAGDADIDVRIAAPSRRQVPCHVQPGRGGEYTVEYTPNETGPHRIEVMYASMPINGSPFTSQVYDSSKVRVNDIPNGYIGKPNSFSIDATQAGPGEVTVDVGNPMHVPEQLQNLGGGRYKCDFTPTNTNRHDITVKFNGELVPGNVFHCDVVDAGNVTVTGSGLDLIPVNQPAQFIVDPHGGPPAEVRVNINEPNGRPLPNRVTHQYDGTHLVEYTPKTVGAHPIDVHYAGLLVPGSPFECIAYDANKVRISDICDGFVGQELGCKIDTSQAGPGTITAEVQQSGRPVNHYLREDPPSSGRYSLMYTPDAARAHEIRVRFNGQAVQGSPFREEVFDPRNAAAFGEGLGTIPVKKATYFIVDPRSAGKADISANISAPSGNMVPSRVVPGRDGTHKVEYTPYEVGPHQADVFYAGYPINGSPFQPVAYDASAVRVSEIPDGRVGQKIGFNIDTSRAGKGDLDVGVNVNNRNVPFEMDSGRQRDNFEVSFLAQEAGTHRIPISFNGDPVQGSPFRSEIKAAGRASASGEGLYRGQEDRTAEFVVDTTDCDNLPLDIQVDGPNSIAKCSVEHRGDKHYVTYVPVEVGIFDITLKHGGQEIDGSPFHPTVIDPRKVRAKGGWNTFLGSNGRLTLFVNERYTLPLDAAEAGPGKMSSMVRGPTGEIPVDIEKRNDGMHFVSFTPVADGEHVVDVNWSDLPIARSPIYGDARASRDALVSHEKVVVRGRGLREAKVGEEAEFIIDGSEAGPGTPEVMMSGLKNDIDVRMVPMTDRPNSYRCYYYPKVPGAYLLNITWSQRQVNGSPFRVSIAPGIDAKKVTFSGLKEGIMGQALRADIDVREAGKGGTLTARCQGPTKRADIDLKDNMNGTFGLTIRPQEGGRHLLEIKYGGEHIQGSPFVLRIAGATDPSKVRVFGPGLKNGLLHTFKGNFICETRGAGAGQLKVRVHGPRGAFRVEMQPLSSKDRTIAVKYNPVEPGDYDIDVKWSDVHVPGSPFRVSIFETQDELDEFEGRQISRIGGSTSRHSRHSGPEYNSYQWQEEI